MRSFSKDSSPMRVVFCWSDISGYMGACWRALSCHPEIVTKVIAYGTSRDAGFSREIMSGIDWYPLDGDEKQDVSIIARVVGNHNPDVVVVAGWLNSAYSELSTRPELSTARFVMTMDTPWRDTLRQRLAPFVLRRHVVRMDAVVVTGERAYQYAMRLGFRESAIFRGLYGVDHEKFRDVAVARSKDIWPRSFLFVGRYVEEKAIDVMVEAYRIYCDRVDDPFKLVTCGQGELDSVLRGVPGIEDRGFLQPQEMMHELASAGCFVIASRFDPWPLALVEACSAGLPVIASSACGSAVENLRDHVNGFVVATGDPVALADAFYAIHMSYDSLADFGAASREFAASYSAEVWVLRWNHILRKLVSSR